MKTLFVAFENGFFGGMYSTYENAVNAIKEYLAQEFELITIEYKEDYGNLEKLLKDYQKPFGWHIEKLHIDDCIDLH